MEEGKAESGEGFYKRSGRYLIALDITRPESS